MAFDEIPLFSFGEDQDNTPKAEPETPIKAEQIERLELAFDEAGIATAHARREIIASCVLRPFDSLQDLLAKDYRPILNRIKERQSRSPRTTGGDWDNREENTWIDKL